MDQKAEFDIILSSVLLKVSELMYKGANGDIPEEACRRLQEVMVLLREVDEMLTPKSRKVEEGQEEERRRRRSP